MERKRALLHSISKTKNKKTLNSNQRGATTYISRELTPIILLYPGRYLKICKNPKTTPEDGNTAACFARSAHAHERAPVVRQGIDEKQPKNLNFLVKYEAICWRSDRYFLVPVLASRDCCSSILNTPRGSGYKLRSQGALRGACPKRKNYCGRPYIRHLRYSNAVRKKTTSLNSYASEHKHSIGSEVYRSFGHSRRRRHLE